jgi:YHS domain-containing protein
MRYSAIWRRAVITACSLVMAMAATTMCATPKEVKGDSVPSTSTVKKLKPQITCPVQGDPIDKKLFVDYNGERIYVCCKSCLADVQKEPEKFIKKLESMGQGVETIALTSKKESRTTTDTSLQAMKMADDTSSKVVAAGYWTCPMHPEIHTSAAGTCPLCGMILEFKKP